MWSRRLRRTDTGTRSGQASRHGLSEVLYAYSSAAENNGSAFAGINVGTPWYDLTLGLAILLGRFLFIIPALAVAGSLATKKKVPETAAGDCGNAGNSRTAVRGRARDRRDCDRRPDVLPSALTRSDRGAFPDAPGTTLFTIVHSFTILS